jgi:hypothetical protein
LLERVGLRNLLEACAQKLPRKVDTKAPPARMTPRRVDRFHRREKCGEIGERRTVELNVPVVINVAHPHRAIEHVDEIGIDDRHERRMEA